MTNELLTLLHADGDHGLQEIHKPFRMISCGEKEIDTVVNFLDVDGVLVGSMLENRLLEEQESTLVGHLLADLDASSPCVVGITLCAIGALVVVLGVFDFEALLHDGAITDLRLHRDLNPDTSRMRLCPDEVGVDDAQFVQAAQFLQAERQKLSGFGLGDDPGVGRAEPSIAVSAHV